MARCLKIIGRGCRFSRLQKNYNSEIYYICVQALNEPPCDKHILPKQKRFFLLQLHGALLDYICSHVLHEIIIYNNVVHFLTDSCVKTLVFSLKMTSFKLE